MKKKLWFYLLMLLLLISLSHCEDMPTNVVPTVETKPVTDIKFGTAKSGGNISDDGGAFITRKGVCWDLTSGLSLDNCVGFSLNGPGMCNYISTISGLEEGKTYFVRAYATNSEGTGYGASENFMTKLTAIDITTSASSIKLNTATLNGTVNPNGENTTVTFEYGLYTNYGRTTTAIQSPISGTAVVAVSADLINLAEGSLYHYRVVADNSGGGKNRR